MVAYWLAAAPIADVNCHTDELMGHKGPQKSRVLMKILPSIVEHSLAAALLNNSFIYSVLLSNTYFSMQINMTIFGTSNAECLKQKFPITCNMF